MTDSTGRLYEQYAVNATLQVFRFHFLNSTDEALAHIHVIREARKRSEAEQLVYSQEAKRSDKSKANNSSHV